MRDSLPLWQLIGWRHYCWRCEEWRDWLGPWCEALKGAPLTDPCVWEELLEAEVPNDRSYHDANHAPGGGIVDGGVTPEDHAKTADQDDSLEDEPS